MALSTGWPLRQACPTDEQEETFPNAGTLLKDVRLMSLAYSKQNQNSMPLHISRNWIAVTRPLSWVLMGTMITIALPAIAQSAPAPNDLTIAQASQGQSMTATTQEFVNLLSEGNFEAASQYLHPVFRQNWSPAQMQDNWQGLQEQTGAFKQFGSIEQADESVVLVSTEFENVTDTLVVIFDETQQWIVGVDFPEQ
jgi:hypothetical protein